MLEIFYKEIIEEASTGSIDCLSKFNIVFETKINQLDINIKNKTNYNNLIIPTLNIINVDLFNELLSEYTTLALDFYDDNIFYEDVIQNTNFLYYKTKTILTLLWANASLENFNDPINYLKKRIAFIKKEYDIAPVSIGYSNLLKGELIYNISKSNIINESPWKFDLKVENNNDIYFFPTIYFGLEEKNLTVYAIQNNNEKRDLTNSFYKYINRKMYKINSGTESLDITHSFLYAFNAFIQIIGSIDNIIVPSFLVSRWNSKEIANNKKYEYYKSKGNEFNLEDALENHSKIQYNLTNKLTNILIMFEDLYENVNFNVISDNPNTDNILSLKYPLITENQLLHDFNLLVKTDNKIK